MEFFASINSQQKLTQTGVYTREPLRTEVLQTGGIRLWAYCDMTADEVTAWNKALADQKTALQNVDINAEIAQIDVQLQEVAPAMVQAAQSGPIKG